MSDPTITLVPEGWTRPRRPEDVQVDEARARLLAARQRTQVAISDFRSGMTEKMEWRTWYRDSPGVFLGLAFLAGFLLARRR